MPPCPVSSEAGMYSQWAHLHRPQIYSTLYTHLATQIYADEKIHHSHRHEQHQKHHCVPISHHISVCLCMYTYVHLLLVDPSSSWALSVCPWIPVSPFASRCTSPPRAAVTSRCWYRPLHTHKDTDANRYSNHAIPPAVLWNSLDALKTSFCCHHSSRDTQTDFQVTLPTQLAHLAYLQTNHKLTTALVPVATSVPSSGSICWNSSPLKHIHIEERYPYIGKS